MPALERFVEAAGIFKTKTIAQLGKAWRRGLS